MVAISLYRGSLHRVSDVPRRWPMPEPNLSHHDFKLLVDRRTRSLARLHSTSTSPNPNPNPNPISVSVKEEEAPESESEKNVDSTSSESENLAVVCVGEPSGEKTEEKELKPEATVSLPDPKPEADEECSDLIANGAKPEDLELEKAEESANPKSELTDVQHKRKREVEEKLLVLKGKKHGLVQLLKQVLNTEEELKRRSITQGTVIRPSEANFSGDGEGGETDALSNQNLHSRQIFRMNSTSPSSESPIRRPPFLQQNPGLHPVARASLGATGSPSRFTPMGHQANAANVPTVSVSGTNYIPSSPSPAASGGTSAFRDSRLPSPWN